MKLKTCLILILAFSSQISIMVNSTSVEIEAGIERKRSKVGHFRSNYQKEEKLLNVDEEKHIPRRHKKAFIQKKFMNFDSMMMLDINNNNTNNTNITLPFKGMKIMTNSSGIGINETGLYPDGMEFTDNIVFDMKMKDQYKRYTKCRDKVGLLYHLQNGAYKDPNNTAITKNGLFSRPTLVVCSQSSFSIQDNLTPQSLLRAIQLPKILRVTQTYKGTTCFDVIEEGKESNPLSLCAESKSEMDEWIVSILEFKECLLKDKFELVDANSNAFAKKPSKEDIRNGRGMVPQEEMKKKLNLPFGTKETPVKPFVPPDALYYTNTFAPTSETLEITETDKTLTRILNDRKREELAQRQIKREVEDKIRKVKEAHKKIALQERKLAHQNAINKKKLIAAATKKIEDKTKAALKNILSDALKNMNKLGVNKFTLILIEKGY